MLPLALALSAVGYVMLVLRFFPDDQGKLGDDYEYFLPLLLAGKYWIAENGFFTVPRFSPAYCGGVPLLANPQSIFYSVPQGLSLVTSPIASMLATTLAFAGIGACSTYVLMRRLFMVSVQAASLSSVLFLFNGLLLHRMASGHATYHVVGLLPLLCYLLLTPVGARPFPLMLFRAAGSVATASAILTYAAYAGALNIVVPFGISCVVVWLVHALLHRPVAAFPILGAASAAISAAAAAAKIVPAAVYVHNFPRLHELQIFDHAIDLYHALFLGLFLPGLLPDHYWIVGKQELEFGVGVVPPLLLVAAYFRFRAHRRWRLGALASLKLAALVLLLLLPLALNYGGTGYAAWLKSLPYIGENVILTRWLLIYVLPLIVGAGLALDYVFPTPSQRSKAALAGMFLTVLPPLAFDGPFYDIHPYDPMPVLSADRALQVTGRPPAIIAVGGNGSFGTRNDGLASGISGFPCYEPMFGYQLESFPPHLVTGLLHKEGTQAVHLRNPACYIYGPENGCAPGDGFTQDQLEDESAFASYRPFAFVLPIWQRWADGVSVVGLCTILLGFALGSRYRLLSRGNRAYAR
jgi:hypothetical protein